MWVLSEIGIHMHEKNTVLKLFWSRIKKLDLPQTSMKLPGLCNEYHGDSGMISDRPEYFIDLEKFQDNILYQNN